MKKEINMLFALLRCAVFGENLSEHDKNEAVEKSQLLYAMARHHDLAHLLDYAYKTNGISANNEETAFKFIKQQAMAVLRYENINLALGNISSLFEEEHIPFIPLKGAVIREMYPEPWMRTSCDIDVLVQENDLDRAEKAIVEKLGFVSKSERNYHDISLYLDDVHLELHFNIKENMENIDPLLSKVWEYASPKKEGGFEYVLTNEFLIFQHIAHLSYHVVNGGIGIKAFMDLHLLESKLEVDKSVLYKMLDEGNLRTLYEMSLKLSNVWFSDAEHDDVILVYQRYILNGGTFGTKMNAIAANSNKKGTFSYVSGRIFMPYEQLCITYPSLKGRKYLLPFYQVKRWCRILTKRRYINVGEEIRANKSVSVENMSEYSKLLESLNLK